MSVAIVELHYAGEGARGAAVVVADFAAETAEREHVADLTIALNPDYS